MNSFLSEDEIKGLGLKSCGLNVKISRYANIYSPETVSIGDNVRIDDFCILSGTVIIGSNVHISAYTALYGKYGIELEDYTGISPKSVVFSAMDDFSGDYLIGPIHDDALTHVTGGKVSMKKYSQIGANCVVFPNITVGEGTVVGACSLVNKSLDAWNICWGCPAVNKKPRSKKLLMLIESESEK